jgi:hypothetical protein
VSVVHELCVPRGTQAVVLRWRLLGAARGARLVVRPLLAVRDVHALARERGELDLASSVEGERVRWQPDRALPAIVARSSGTFRPEPLWYRDFLLEEERARGHDHVADLAAPATSDFALHAGAATHALGA